MTIAMETHCPNFRTGVALTAFIAVMALTLSHLPGLRIWEH
jgi:pterin-4a-carbinolamine dehydratase